MKICLKSFSVLAILPVFILMGLFFSTKVFAQAGSGEGAQGDVASLKKEIEKLKDEKAFEAKRVEEMRQEREQFVKEIRRVESLNQKYTKEIDSVRSQILEQQDSFEQRLKKMEMEIAEKKNHREKVAPVAPVENVLTEFPVDVERKANEILMKGGDLDPEDEKFKEELARAHYNMGNVYFERGEYQRSVVEYYQAVDLMPYDADAHYNLAFVSGEYIGDQETALKHYKLYLYIKPDAPDRKLVEEKLVTARLHGRSNVHSRIDKPEQTGHLNVYR